MEPKKLMFSLCARRDVGQHLVLDAAGRPARSPSCPGSDTDAARTLLARLRDPDDPPRALTDAELSGLLAC
jgi:hypothetical protein